MSIHYACMLQSANPVSKTDRPLLHVTLPACAAENCTSSKCDLQHCAIKLIDRLHSLCWTLMHRSTISKTARQQNVAAPLEGWAFRLPIAYTRGSWDLQPIMLHILPHEKLPEDAT